VHRNTWKSLERFWAAKLGGKRVPVSGRTRGDQPDVEHPLWAIEVKSGKTLSSRLQEGMAQAVKSAEIAFEREPGKPKKIPLLCITHSRMGSKGSVHWVAMRLEDFEKMYVR
jgi:hypothetical protein